jgi:hypothetical protein
MADPTDPVEAVAIAPSPSPRVEPQRADATAASALQSLLPHLLRLLRREPAVAITIGYLLVAMAGIFYNDRYYAKFGIPVLTLSQIGDFLVAGVQQPVALLLVLSTVPLCWVFDYFNARSRRKNIATRDRLRLRRDLSAWQRLRLRVLDWHVREQWYTQLGYAAVVVCYGWMFVTLYADYRADRVRRGEAAEVRIWLQGEAAGLQPKQGQSWTYLGAIASYVFVYDHVGARSVILPVDNIERIEPVKSDAGSRSGPLVVPIP